MQNTDPSGVSFPQWLHFIFISSEALAVKALGGTAIIAHANHYFNNLKNTLTDIFHKIIPFSAKNALSAIQRTVSFLCKIQAAFKYNSLIATTFRQGFQR